MSDMKGNPHIEDYEKDLNSDLVEFDAEVMQLHATLALAYEQRTANLIAAFGKLENVDGDPTWLVVHEDDGKNLAREIRERLGMGAA